VAAVDDGDSAAGVRWESVRELVASDRRGALVTVVAGPGLGAKLMVTPDRTVGSLGDPALDAEAVAVARELLAGEEAAVREMAGRQLFFDVFAPQPRLLIVGAVDFAAALARAASDRLPGRGGRRAEALRD
jgi:xanthine dehydrogenase accessory factor